jgi:hypothetical protein
LAVVIKGGARGGAGKLAVHLQRTDTNERAELVEVRGLAANDIDGALAEMEAVASGARTRRPLYHASINTRADEPLTDEQRTIAVDRLEEVLGLTGQPRVIVDHLKEGKDGIERAHTHVVWSRIDLDDMTAIPDSHNYRKHEEAARALEQEFGHKRVQGAHVEREEVQRPERTPSQAEMMQAERSGMTPEEVKRQVTDLWQQTDNGQAFAAALADAGYTLARGDRRDFVVIDPAGETHSLARRVDGMKAADVRARMADVDPANLPTVAEARTQWQEQKAEKQSEVAKEEPQPVQQHKGNRHADSVAGELFGGLFHAAIGDVIMGHVIDSAVEGIAEHFGAEAGEIAHTIGEGIEQFGQAKDALELTQALTGKGHGDKEKPRQNMAGDVLSGTAVAAEKLAAPPSAPSPAPDDPRTLRRIAFQQMIEQEKAKELERKQQQDWNFGVGQRIDRD